jgi:two-component system sensor histidine kinase KdpD
MTSQAHATERIVVAVSGAPGSERLIRRAAQIAQRGSAELSCVHILVGENADSASASTLTDLRRLAQAVGGSFHIVVGQDVPTALLEFARASGATQLVLGVNRRWATWPLRGHTTRSVLREIGGLGLHLVSAEASGGTLRLPARRSALSAHRRLLGWLCGLVLPGLATLVAVAGRGVFALSTDVMLFVLAVVAVALIGGLGPALLAVTAAGLLLNFFLTEPLYTFTIAEQQNVITLVVMLLVAVMVALVVDQAARRAAQASRSQAEASLLSEFAATVLTGPEPLPLLLDKVRVAFNAASVALLERVQERWWRLASAGPDPVTAPEDAEVDVALDANVHLALRGRTLSSGDRRVLHAVAGQALLVLQAQRMAAQARDAQRRAEATELRSALLSAVGHDLRTPLTAIKAAASSLRDPELALSAADTGELLATVEESADRLQALVDNLLDSARLATGAVVPQLRAVGYDEIVARALSIVDGGHRVAVDLDDTLPTVHADPGLLERVVANLIDNALRHGHGRSVTVRAAVRSGYGELRISDRGPGLPAERLDSLFAPFQRFSDRSPAPGLGLGLAVSRGFTEAMGGHIRATQTPGGGLTMTISLPLEPAIPAAHQMTTATRS